METVKFKVHTKGCEPLVNLHGDWVDLRSAEDLVIKAPIYNIHTNELEFQTGLISLGITIQAPEGYEIHVTSRSSTYKKFGIMMTNSIGIIDYSYRGKDDIIHFPYIGMKEGVIKKGDRIAQFRIVPSQFKSDNPIVLECVEEIEEVSRGGVGSTGWE